MTTINSSKQPLKRRNSVPTCSVLEFRDVASKFSSRSQDHKNLMDVIQSDPDVMTRDTGRLNKTKLCKATKLNTRRIDELINELREAFK